MNFNTYGSYYGQFHQCPVSSVQQNVLIFQLVTAPYETWFVTRLHPPDKVVVDSQKPLLLALKTFFKTDVPASVVCHRNYLWTVCLGNERIVYPTGPTPEEEGGLQLYATPYYVKSADEVTRYLQGSLRPAYEHVFFYKNTVLYLDNQDLPYPGGSYWDDDAEGRKDYYRLCLVSDEPAEHVLRVAQEWSSRRDVLTIPFMTRERTCVPKFINFRPVGGGGSSSFEDAVVASTGLVHKALSALKPDHLIQDVLNSYYANVARRGQGFGHCLGLYIEWPFTVTFEGARHTEEANKQFVALSVNGAHPDRVLVVRRPYERYLEHTHVPATLWTPVSYALTTLLTDRGVRKVALDSTVVGVVYRDAFFCLSQPLLEGTPTQKPVVNGQYLLSPAAHFELNEDANVRVLETFKLDDQFSLRRVSLKGLSSLDAWCLSPAAPTDPPFPRTIQLPGLVKQWIEFRREVGGGEAAVVDVRAVRLALMLSRHRICFHLNAVPQTPSEVIRVSDNRVNFYLDEKTVQFINDARMCKKAQEEEETRGGCTLS